MNPVSPLFALLAVGIALVTCYLIMKLRRAPTAHGKYESIDGLRGYLALGVFLHHAQLTYFVLHTNKLDLETSRLYTHFGQTSVALFFMITSFLFCRKLLELNGKAMSWPAYFVSRFFRLTPLFLVLILLLTVLVLHQSHGIMNQPVHLIALSWVRWLTFAMSGTPAINGVEVANYGGAVWSLRYEWVFYLVLPLLGLLSGTARPGRFLIASFVGIGLAIFLRMDAQIMLGFVGGIVAALLKNVPSFSRLARSSVGTALVISCLTLEVALFASAYGFAQVALLTLAFSLIANGNTIWGALSRPVSKFFGEMTYSIYLLHGIVLNGTIYILIGADNMRALSVGGFWAVVLSLIPVVILLSFITYTYIELPGMRIGKRISQYRRVEAIKVDAAHTTPAQ